MTKEPLMPPIQTHINARVDPLYHVTRTRGGGETTELLLKSFISSDDVRGAAAVSLTRWVSRSHTPLIYHQVGCSDESGCYFGRFAEFAVLFCPLPPPFRGQRTRTGCTIIITPGVISHVFGRNPVPVKTKCPNIY